jgi:hypothetical protein
MVEWLTALLRIRQVPGSYLGLEIGYPDWGFSWDSRPTLKLGHDSLLPSPFKFIIHLSFDTV